MDKKKTVTLNVTGMSCAACANIIEKRLMKVPGVAFAAVNLATDSAFVTLDRDVPIETLEEAVRSAGYQVVHGKAVDIEKARYRQAWRNMLISSAVTVVLMVMMVLHMTGRHVPNMVLYEFVGTAIVLFVAGWGTLNSARIALTHKHANMDVLVSLGGLAAWFTTILNMAGVDVLSFGTIGAMIVTLHLIGRFIESRLRDKAAKEIKALLALQAKETRLVKGDEVIMVPTEAVKVGQLIIVKPGESIPLDGVVKDGRSAVNESMITGEAVAVEKNPGDRVVGGSISASGSLTIEVTSSGENGFLSQMIAMVQEAQGAKIPIQAFADKVTGIFVPMVVTLALVSGLFWFFFGDRFHWVLVAASHYLPWVNPDQGRLSLAVFTFLSTLLIACPCALGLATPMALITGTGAASKKGLIVRNAEAIQTMKNISVAILDKTGTITLGHPEVVFHDLDDESAKVVAAIESSSNHPLAQAISQIAPFSDVSYHVKEVAGEGVYAEIDGTRWYVGKPTSQEGLAPHLNLGQTVVEVKKDGVRVGILALEDPIRPNAKEAVKRLADLHIKVVMATGDNQSVANKVALQVGIDDVYAGVKPDEKLSIVRKYQSEHQKVLMMGDGINDAGALKGADIGVAVGSGSDLAIESADMVVVRGGIQALADGIGISKKTFKIIRQNLFWAFGYNFIALPLAMMGMLHPLMAEVAMTMSSISVILNSLRISAKD